MVIWNIRCVCVKHFIILGSISTKNFVMSLLLCSMTQRIKPHTFLLLIYSRERVPDSGRQDCQWCALLCSAGSSMGNRNRLWNFYDGTPSCMIDETTCQWLFSLRKSTGLLQWLIGDLEISRSYHQRCPSQPSSQSMTKNLSARLNALARQPVQAVTSGTIKLSCINFTPYRCGLSFEIIDVLWKEGKPSKSGFRLIWMKVIEERNLKVMEERK